MEIWMDVTGFEGEFAVSNYGRVKSLERYVKNGNGRRIVRERIRVQGKHPQGYLTIAYKVDSPPLLVHRVVALHFIPNPDKKAFVNHKDGNKQNNRVDNLEWATRQENEDHAYETGLKNSTGSNNSMAKLNEDKVRMIRTLSKTGASIKDLASEYGVHRVTIGRIINNRVWASV